MDFPLLLYVSLTLFQVFRVVSAPVPDRALHPNVQTCAQVMALQLYRKVQKTNLTQRKLAKMLYDCSLFREGVCMSDIGSQARDAYSVRTCVSSTICAPNQHGWSVCVPGIRQTQTIKNSTTFIHVASIPLERVFFDLSRLNQDKLIK